jgi:nicotinic acid mononucleotide adenylyltransferase
VAARPGWEPEPSSDRIEVFELSPQHVSSTEIRERAKRGESLDGLVVPAVAAYIEERDLYRGA